MYNDRYDSSHVFLEFANVSRFKNMLKCSAYIDFNLYWNNYSGAKHTKSFFPQVLDKKFCYPFLFRKSEKLYYRLSFTQNFLNEFLYKINKSDTDLCRFCENEVETCAHVFCECDDLDHSDLVLACVREKKGFNLKNLITFPGLKISVEKFIKIHFLK